MVCTICGIRGTGGTCVTPGIWSEEIIVAFVALVALLAFVALIVFEMKK